MNARIISTFGYQGLPTLYLIQSQYGWLGTEGFVPTLAKAWTFRNQKEAFWRFRKLFPYEPIKIP